MASNVMTAFEAQYAVGDLRNFCLAEYGTHQWLIQHKQLQKINMQAHEDAKTRHDEFIVSELIGQGRVAMLIEELIIAEAWSDFIFPLISEKIHDNCYVKVYSALYQEAVLANLLQIVMYHGEAVEAADDLIMELIDYCYRKLVALNAGSIRISNTTIQSKDITVETTEERLIRNMNKLRAESATASISILRFITENIERAGISAMERILNTKDVILAVIPLICDSPWTRKDRGKLEKFVDNAWIEKSAKDMLALTSIEAELWLIVYNLTMDKECQKKYKFNEMRQNEIMKLKRFMNNTLIDQLPVLTGFHRFLEQLSFMEIRDNSKESVLSFVTLVSEVREKLLRETDFKTLAMEQLNSVFTPNEEELRRDMKLLSEIYSPDNVEHLMSDPKCGKCGKTADQRCSRCKMEWYCCRKCQVAGWKDHKKICKKLAAAKANKSKISEVK